jgi:hypothetical protein
VSGRAPGKWAALAVLLVSWLQPLSAQARRLFRARFEVGTLEVEKPGALAIDGQLGATYGDGSDGSRLVVPDFELDIGLLKWLELDIDSAYSLVQLESGEREWVGEPVWTALRFDLYSWEREETGRTFGVGLQVGPRFPNLRNLGGVGFAGLLLFGGGTRTFHVVANVGGTVELAHAFGLIYGVGFQQELSDEHKIALVGQLAAITYFDDSPNQLLLSVGAQKALNEELEVQLVVLGGPAYEGDRIGVLAGATYRHGLW